MKAGRPTEMPGRPKEMPVSDNAGDRGRQGLIVTCANLHFPPPTNDGPLGACWQPLNCYGKLI